MKRGLAALIACSGVLVIAGCGSSSKPASGSSAAGSSATSSSATSASTASTHTSSLKVTGKPKYGAPPASAPVQSGLVQIAYRNIAINPDTVKVKVGSTIKWTNYDSIEHNVTSEGRTSEVRLQDLRRRRQLRDQGEQAGGHPLPVHDPSGFDERDDRRRQMRAGAS